MPDLYMYDDFRRFLRDWMEEKAKSGHFSGRWFARRAGFRAENMMHLVMQGKRNLARESLRKFIIGLGLKDKEADYFESLVGMNQAKSHEERRHYYDLLIKHPGRRKVHPMEEAQLAFFQHWLAPVIYEMIGFPDFQPDPHWIAAQFDPEPSTLEVRDVLKDLLRSGLVKKDSDGTWRQAVAQLHSGDDVNNVHLFAYHEQALAKAADALHEVAPSRRQFHVVTAAVPQAKMLAIMELTQKFESDLAKLIEGGGDAKDQVVQVGLHLFPLLRLQAAPKLRVPLTKKKRGA